MACSHTASVFMLVSEAVRVEEYVDCAVRGWSVVVPLATAVVSSLPGMVSCLPRLGIEPIAPLHIFHPHSTSSLCTECEVNSTPEAPY